MSYEFVGDVDCKDEVPGVRCTECGLDAEAFIYSHGNALRNVELYRCRCVKVGCVNRPKEREWVSAEFRWNGDEWEWQE